MWPTILKGVDITIQKYVNNFNYAVNVLSRKYRHLRDTLTTNKLVYDLDKSNYSRCFPPKQMSKTTYKYVYAEWWSPELPMTMTLFHFSAKMKYIAIQPKNSQMEMVFFVHSWFFNQ